MDADLPENIVEQQQAAFDYYKTQTTLNEGMKELIRKGLKNREETIARQKESNALEMQVLRDVKGKKSIQIDQRRGPIKEATTLADAEVAEL